MTKSTYQYVIIGAGLSGLTIAYFLKKKGITNFIILEANDRIGGRILTKNQIELGATWFHKEHTALVELLDELCIGKFPDYCKGNHIMKYSSAVPPYIFKADTGYSPGFRIEGGSKQLLETLIEKSEATISTKISVKAIHKLADKLIEIHTDNLSFLAENVIITLPPKLATNLEFLPQLPNALSTAMESSHTWMSNAIKFGITYENPFWIEKGFSGTVHGHTGAIREIYDHSNNEATFFALKGFANEALRSFSKEERKEKIINSLSSFFGMEALNYINFYEKDWSKDKYVVASTFESLYMSPKRNNTPLEKSYWESSLFFAGAETSNINAGYMDGAVRSAVRIMEQIF